MQLKNLSLAAKTFLLIAVAMIFNVMVEGWGLYKQRQTLLAGKRIEVSSIVQATSAIVAEFGRKAEAGEIPKVQAQAAALAVIRSLRYNSGEYVWINDMNHVVIMHPIKPELDGKDVSGVKDPAGTFMFKEFVKVAKSDGAGFVDYLWPKPGFDKPVAKTSYVQLYRPWGWVIGSGLYLDDVQSEFVSTTTWTAVAMLAVIGATFGLAWLFIRNVARPLTNAVGAVQRLAEEDLSVEDGDKNRGDEIGDLARAIATFRTKLIERQDLARREDAEHAEKERRREASEHLVRDFSTTISGVLAQLSNVSSDMSASADQVNQSASVTTEQAVAVSASAEQTSGNVQTVAAAAQQLAASIHEVTRQVGQASQVTQEAQKQADSTAGTVSRLQSAAGQINEVVELISSIAAQTNLLALNATIEAARAGEAGKGFAVVASEVKGLATQTAKATGEIARQIAEMQQVSSEATDAIAMIVTIIERVGTISMAVASAMDEQNAATQEIVRSVKEVEGGTSLVAKSIGSVRGAASDSNRAATTVAATATQLGEQTSALREEVASFLGAITNAGERRNYTRTPCDIEAIAETAAGTVGGRLMNIGLGGALFRGRIDGHPGQSILLLVGGERLQAQLVETGDPARVRFLLDGPNQASVAAALKRLAA